MTISGEMLKWRRVVHRCASGFMFLFFAVFAVYGAWRFLWALSLLRFRTLENEETQARDLSEIAQVREWRGRGWPLGYRLDFRDGAKAYLQYSATNATALGEQLQFGVRLS